MNRHQTIEGAFFVRLVRQWTSRRVPQCWPVFGPNWQRRFTAMLSLRRFHLSRFWVSYPSEREAFREQVRGSSTTRWSAFAFVLPLPTPKCLSSTTNVRTWVSQLTAWGARVDVLNYHRLPHPAVHVGGERDGSNCTTTGETWTSASASWWMRPPTGPAVLPS